MIRLVLADIDGVLTDGKFTVKEKSGISKMLNFKDLDAITSLKQKGYQFGIITGEKDYFTEYVFHKTKPDYFEAGCKDKKNAMLKIADKGGFELNEVCYIGDGKYDVDALEASGLGVCPADGIEEAKRISDVILETKGGDGCMAELLDILCFITEKKENAIDIACIFFQHKILVDRLLRDKKIQAAVEEAVSMIVELFQHEGQLFFCGNGGSAADAQHLATEFVSRFYMERKALNAEALTVNTSSLTAIGNDYSYEQIFARQVEAKGKPGDILIGISTSGRSANILEAFRRAGKIGLQTIAFVGEDVTEVQEIADLVISVPSGCTPRVQEMHIMIGHIICEYVEKILFGYVPEK